MSLGSTLSETLATLSACDMSVKVRDVVLWMLIGRRQSDIEKHHHQKSRCDREKATTTTTSKITRLRRE
jgi:hypothetical protein